ncbi:MAG: nicotinamide-nucleotide amidohydrolase family protein [candidate division WOR-3 bacterium]|nr:MAG: nicotinamide-nucleotide amidohydrolase family protein [candidate division WOR-3 bacterium]
MFYSIAREVGKMLLEKRLSLSVCESCTGGMLGAAITSIPGSSRYFAGGVIAYSDAVKKNIVGVKRSTLERYGAVSAQTAREMARGVKNKLKTDVGVAITGIAGPGGGTAKKPVGLVYIAVAHGKRMRAERFVFAGGRQNVRRSSLRKAFDMVREILCVP